MTNKQLLEGYPTEKNWFYSHTMPVLCHEPSLILFSLHYWAFWCFPAPTPILNPQFCLLAQVKTCCLLTTKVWLREWNQHFGKSAGSSLGEGCGERQWPRTLRLQTDLLAPPLWSGAPDPDTLTQHMTQYLLKPHLPLWTDGLFGHPDVSLWPSVPGPVAATQRPQMARPTAATLCAHTHHFMRRECTALFKFNSTGAPGKGRHLTIACRSTPGRGKIEQWAGWL